MSPVPTPPGSTLSTPSPTDLPLRRSSNPFNYAPYSHDTDDDEPVDMERAIRKTTTVSITTIPAALTKPIYIIVATALNPPMGIGYKGDLPWKPIRADMAFFRSVTSTIPSSDPSSPLFSSAPSSPKSIVAPTHVNAVLMGRKTWASIPPRFRPLAGRLNVIITRSSPELLGRRIVDELRAKPGSRASWTWTTSRDRPDWQIAQVAADTPSTRARNQPPELSTLITQNATTDAAREVLRDQAPSPVLVSNSVSGALALLNTPGALPDLEIGSVFCIGGAEIYRQVLELPPHANPARPSAEEEEDDEKHANATADSAGDEVSPTVRILQTQVRSTNGKPIECDTFFPANLGDESEFESAPGPETTHAASGEQTPSRTWRAASPDELALWIGTTRLPQGKAFPEGADDGNWLADEKAGVQIRTVGWERA